MNSKPPSASANVVGDEDGMNSGKADDGGNDGLKVGKAHEGDKPLLASASFVPGPSGQDPLSAFVVPGPLGQHPLSASPVRGPLGQGPPSASVVSGPLAAAEAIDLFSHWSECQRCCKVVISSVGWRRQVCDRNPRDFLEGMYVLTSAKLFNLQLCDNHIPLLSSKLYLVDAPPFNLRARLEKIWESRQSFTCLASLMDDQPLWFEEELSFK